MMWVFLAEDSILVNDDKTDTVFCKLRHPKTEEGQLYLFSHCNKSVHQIDNFKEDFRSWVVGQTIQEDGSLYITSKVDPLFLVLPYLIKSQKMFMQLDQIIQDDDFPDCRNLETCRGTEEIHHVCDIKGDDDLKVYRYNQDKTLQWLKCKVEKVAEALKNKCIHVTAGAVSADYCKGSRGEVENKDDYIRYAHGIVSDYLSMDLGKQLKEYLGLPDLADLAPIPEPPTKKAKLSENVAPAEDYSAQNGIKQETKKVTKLNAAAKKLSKVDKTGMKNISSFFAMKPKK